MFMLAVLALSLSLACLLDLPLSIARLVSFSVFHLELFLGAKCSTKVQTIFKAIDRPQQIFHIFHYFNSGNMTHVSMDSTYYTTLCVYSIRHTHHEQASNQATTCTVSLHTSVYAVPLSIFSCHRG